jgi:hypothetical protein
MQQRLRSYRLTLLAIAILALSFAIFLLGSNGALPTTGIWRPLVIPAYLTMLVGAVLRTAFPAVSGLPDGVVILAGVALCLLPFFTIDWLLGRRRLLHGAPAA